MNTVELYLKNIPDMFETLEVQRRYLEADSQETRSTLKTLEETLRQQLKVCITFLVRRFCCFHYMKTFFDSVINLLIDFRPSKRRNYHSDRNGQI